MIRQWKKSIPHQLLLIAALCATGVPARSEEPGVTPAAYDGVFPFRRRTTTPPVCDPGVPQAPAVPGTMPPTNPPGTNPPPNPMNTNPMNTGPQTADTSETGGRGAALASGSLAFADPGGYLDNVKPMNMFRVRYDYMFNFNRPDRSEFFMAAWREISFHPHGIVNENGTFQATAGKGMDPVSQSLNFQEVSAYLELARSNRFSVFAEVPFRMVAIRTRFIDNDAALNPAPAEPGGTDPHESAESGQDTTGNIGDVVLGFKYALLQSPERTLTFQLRAFFPSGDSRNGMGTGHYSLEPGLLYSRRINERLNFQGEFKTWIPLGGTTSAIDGSNWDGVVLTYGAGIGYDIIQRGNFRVTPLIELVGWTVLDGFETVLSPDHSPLNVIAGVPFDHAVQRSNMASILNLKVGVRTYLSQGDDIYVGFGQALTAERWYNQIARIEYRRTW